MINSIVVVKIIINLFIQEDNPINNFTQSNKIVYIILTIFSFSFIFFGFFFDTPNNIISGLIKIIMHPDILITDYIEVAGIGSSFINSGLLALISILFFYFLKIDLDGFSIATVFLMAGFALFGKNIFNIWFIIIGVFFYAKVKREHFSNYVHVALLGSSMAPTITEFLFVLERPLWIRLILTISIGIGIGFILPPLASHMKHIHKGYNLYNVGFTAGIISTIYVSLSKSYGYVVRSNMTWSFGNDLELGIFLFIIFILFIGIGFYLNGMSFKGLGDILRLSGRLPNDFISVEGFAPSLVNMGLNGLVALFYVLLVGGPLNGPTIGGILTISGFGAYGKHIKNMLPILIGVVLGSLTKIWEIDDPAILIAALFGTALAPIAGKYGWKYGILAGFINSSVVLNVGTLHGGLNLYNTGFSAGIVAAFMVPVIEAFHKSKTETK